MNKNNQTQKLTYFFAVIQTLILLGALILIGLRSIFSRYIADEYCLAYIGQQKGLWGSLLYWYNGWTGKYSYILFATFVEFLGLKIFPFIPIIVLILWIISLYWTLHEIFKLIRITINKLYVFYLTLVIVFIHLWSMPTIGQSFYWESASPYTIPLVLLTINIGLIVRQLQFKSCNPFIPFTVFMVAGIAGGFSETFVSMQTTALLISIILIIKKYNFQKKKTLLILLFAALLGSSVSLLIITLAPGNAVRQSLYPPPNNAVWPALVTVFYSFYYLLSSIKTLVAGLFIIPISIFISKEQNNIFYKNKNLRKIILIISGAVYIIILGSIAPTFFALSQPPFNRNLAIPNFILVIYSIFIGYLIGLVVSKKNYRIILILSMILIIIPISYSLKIIHAIPNYNQHAKKWDVQNKYIIKENQRGKKDITIKALGYTEELEDIQKDRSHWVNVCMAQYYGLHSIKAE